MSAVFSTLSASNEYSASELTPVNAILLNPGDYICRKIDVGVANQNWESLRIAFKVSLVGSHPSQSLNNGFMYVGLCAGSESVLNITSNKSIFVGVSGHGYNSIDRFTNAYTSESNVTISYLTPLGSINISGSTQIGYPVGATGGWQPLPRYETKISSSHPHYKYLEYPWAPCVIDILRIKGPNSGSSGQGFHVRGIDNYIGSYTSISQPMCLVNFPKDIFRTSLLSSQYKGFNQEEDSTPSTVLEMLKGFFGGNSMTNFSNPLWSGWNTKTNNSPITICREDLHGPLEYLNIGYSGSAVLTNTKLAIRDIVISILY